MSFSVLCQIVTYLSSALFRNILDTHKCQVSVCLFRYSLVYKLTGQRLLGECARVGWLVAEHLHNVHNTHNVHNLHNVHNVRNMRNAHNVHNAHKLLQPFSSWHQLLTHRQIHWQEKSRPWSSDDRTDI